MKLATILSVVGLSLVTGCAAQTDVDDGDDQGVSADEAIKSGLVAGTFEMYHDVGHKPSGCDVHTRLELSNPAKANLEEVVGGMCMIAIQPNARHYRLHLTGTPCGSKIYEGSFHAKDGVHSIKVSDHRSRLCMDMLAAQVITEETVPGAGTTKLYSMWPKADSTEVTLTGSLFTSAGIGGENTGYSIKSGKDVFELVLDAGEEKSFVDGKTARVKGTKTVLNGVETHDRPAIQVTDILVCPNPGWINCMPGPTPRGPLCAAENRSWISANCSGVGFAD